MDEPKQLPRTIQNEAALLGSILWNNAVFWRVSHMVEESDFASPQHRAIFSAAAKIIRDGGAADILSVKVAMGPQTVESVGSAFISGLVDGIPNIAHAEEYAEAVVAASKARRIIVACREAETRAFASEDAGDITSTLVTALTRTAVRAKHESKPLADLFAEDTRRKDEQAARKLSDSIPTGRFKELDSRYAIRPTLVVVGAPSGHGKSAFLLNLWLSIADKNDAAMPLYSLEMTEREVSDRVTSIMTGIPLRRVRDWRWLNDDERAARNQVQKWLEKRRSQIFFADRVRTLDQMYADARRLKSSHGLTAIFIDHLQLLRGMRLRSREEEMALIASELLEIAIDLRISVIAASQVNKDRVHRESGRLSQGDLKYASAIGDSARVVLMFQRPWYDNKADSELRDCETKFQIEKNSEGTVGDYPMHFNAVTQQFTEGTCEQTKCRHTRQAPLQEAM